MAAEFPLVQSGKTGLVGLSTVPERPLEAQFVS